MSKSGYSRTGPQNANAFGFGTIKPYETGDIERIKEKGTDFSDLPVAVPSPFGRLFLVKTAFERLTKQIAWDREFKEAREKDKHLNEILYIQQKPRPANDEDLRLVSDTLDLAELVFWRHTNLNEITILGTDLSQDSETIDKAIAKLISDNAATKNTRKELEKLKNLIDSISLYAGMDNAALSLKDNTGNFNMHLIEYEGNVIGGTSWQTLFVPSADENFNGIHINSDRKTGDVPKGLEQRKDREFKEWLKYVVGNRTGSAILNYVNALDINAGNNDYPEKFCDIDVPQITEMFEDYLIVLPYDASDNFICGSKNGKTYLPPIKSGVDIEYEKIEYIPFPERNEPTIVTVKYGDREKIYGKKVKEGQGKILTCHFNVALFPYASEAREYRIALIEDTAKEMEAMVSVSINDAAKYERENTSVQKLTLYKKYSAKEITLDVDYNGNSFCAQLPMRPIRELAVDANYIFAIDFGSTNTNIAYKINNNEPKHSFELDGHLATLLKFKEGTPFSEDVLTEKFISKKINGTYFRTLLADTPTHNTTANEVDVLGKFNIPYGYRDILTEDNISDNLKWSLGNQKYKIFLEQIAFELHAKVLLTGGVLEKTKIIYTYPLSMNKEERSALKFEWQKLGKFYFGDGNTFDNLEDKAESITPIKYLHAKGSGLVLKRETPIPVLSVDIGGGTTDCSVITNKDGSNASLLFPLSFRFAGKDIFGGDSNALTEKYGKEFRDNTLKEKTKYKKVLENIINKKSDVNSYLFSLEDILERDDKYSVVLHRDKNVRIVFLYFFSAIIWFLAKALKENFWKENYWKKSNSLDTEKDIPFPSTIYFTGNGARILDIFEEADFENGVYSRPKTTALAKYIFEKVYGRKMKIQETADFKIDFFSQNSKTLTGVGCFSEAKILDVEKAEDLFISEDRLRGNKIDDFNKVFLDIIKTKKYGNNDKFLWQAFDIATITADNGIVKFKLIDELEMAINEIDIGVAVSNQKTPFEILHLIILNLFKKFVNWQSSKKGQ
ncbi:MAG: hypothetical protein LBC75_03830 [Fibromonadaceae bacterium]|jgi:hypothetical protein|nr:hypothetical protein [Fibromonadaceae bacterium]